MPYSPWSKILCPYCLQESHPSDCLIAFSNPNTSLPTARPGRPLEDIQPPTKWFARLRSRFKVIHLVGPNAVFGDAARECPHCNSKLPTNIEMVKNYIIGLIGLTGSGKTSFIATSIHELVAGAVGSALDIQLSPASEYVEQKYQNDYYKVVYNNIPPAGTVPAQGYDPLIYTLKRHGQPDVNLIFYDVAGEDLAGPSAVARYGRFVFYAHAFIALEDPLSIDAISQHVVPNERLKDDTFEQVNGKDVLTWVIDLYQRYQNGRKTIRIPTAITLSKSDVLKYAQQRARYTFFTEPPYQDKIHTPRLTQRDFMNVDGDVQSFLRGVENSEGLRLLGWKRQFKNAHYFAISATGRPVNIAAGVAPDIEPRRVLDPLLWVLWQLNIVPAQ